MLRISCCLGASFLKEEQGAWKPKAHVASSSLALVTNALHFLFSK